MYAITRKSLKIPMAGITVLAMLVIVVLGAISGARADESDVRNLLQVMSDYIASQNAISFDFDATLEVTTKDDQKLALASSGSIIMNRPDKIRARRSGGHADIEMVFDGETLTLFGSNLNLYSQIEVPGEIDNLIDVLRNDYNRPLPAADLLLSNVYDELMDGVIDIKDLGSGVINGIECDYFAFRNEEVDWQIWITQEANPYPIRYTITSKNIPHSPQYTIQIRNWKTGSEVESDDFVFTNSTNAEKVDVEDLKGMSPLPDHFERGDTE